jgi:hypothetical protein
VLYSQKDVIGYAGVGQQRRPSNRALAAVSSGCPGAIAAEFVSTSARTFARPPDTWKHTQLGEQGGLLRQARRRGLSRSPARRRNRRQRQHIRARIWRLRAPDSCTAGYSRAAIWARASIFRCPI